ncbi:MULTISPECIES: SDR family NAD(P)-dependent oxidoreductase [Paenibacillus]|uniref:SDR family NAD(P)-dependent oxidoreductase n=1 Tax=Paenibacillus TaxID=44249 RepID=UPI00070F0684|nr:MULTISPECIES: SDR family NAD(P)-dependent oxidoreductase [Paenibacillus]KQX49174.1 UDP-N-acetylglucosamine 4,6-dehydratase [Paenibacillus sp. Root444D2]KRE48650.1 UDP-N-acetylglucosamine 4,6-dehydratase [Paenibacillus sp. Soil724D2]NRF95263.1 SDR family NAD(P)-dependent oxidoreductase [Paenibacillus frigoriresistens]
MFTNTTILVTGGTGSWGYELIEQLLPENPKKIIVFSRNESTQVAMKRAFDDPRLSFCIGDVRDRDALMKACEKVDYLFHLAALKHVPVCEDQPYEALKTNVNGTQNVIEAAIENKVKKVINISTDKAANPSNFYGMTKSIGEKLIVNANLLNSGTKFVCVRGGNVLGTNGSVIHLFMKQIKEKEQIGITDREMTRFFLTQREAIGLLLRATEVGQGGEIFVMTMPTCKILDLAEVLIESLGNKKVEIVELGIRPGEKIHEILLTEYESKSTVMYDDKYLVILPSQDIPGLKAHYSHYPKVEISSFCSSQSLMNKEKIKDMLVKGGFLS